MATNLVSRRDGLKLECTERKRPNARGSVAYPVPTIPAAGMNSLLALSLVTIEGSGRKGILVESTPPTLPGAGTWTLQHLVYQGTRPTTPTWREYPVTAPKISYTVRDAAPDSYHVFRLRQVEAQEKLYPEATITTPADTTVVDLQGILSDDIISRAEKPLFNRMVSDLTASVATDVAGADEWDLSHVDLSAALADLLAWLGALSPVLSDLTQDTSLGTGGGATLTTKWHLVTAEREAVRVAVAAAIQSGLGAMLSDDKVSPGEKRRVKLERDQIQSMKTELNAVATASGLSIVALNAAVMALESFLDSLAPWNPTTHDWDDYTTTAALGTGNGAILYSKFTDVRTAEAAFRQLASSGTWQQILAFADDAIVSKMEKPAMLVEWARIRADEPWLVSQASAVGADYSYYYGAYDDLSTYLSELSPAYNDLTQDTPVTATVWRGQWNGYYLQRTKLINAIAAAVNSRASDAATAAGTALGLTPKFLSYLPTLPDSDYPVGKVVFLTADWSGHAAGCYRNSAGAWIVAPFAAAQIIGELVAGQISAGAIGANQLAADLIMASVIRSTGYVAGSEGVAPIGFKLSGTAWWAELFDGSALLTNLEIGKGASFGGYKVETVANKVMMAASGSARGSSTFGVTSATQMAGLGHRFTPGNTRTVVVIMAGSVHMVNAGTGSVSMRYGTGTEPSPGDGDTGTFVPGTLRNFTRVVDGAYIGITLTATITLTKNVNYWFDWALNASSGATTTLYDGASFLAFEV